MISICICHRKEAEMQIKGSLPMCFIFVFQKHMVDVSYSIFSISSHVFILALPFTYQITALETLKSIIFPTMNNLANSQILRKKTYLPRARCFKVFCFLKSLEKIPENPTTPFWQVLVFPQSERKPSSCPKFWKCSAPCQLNFLCISFNFSVCS